MIISPNDAIQLGYITFPSSMTDDFQKKCVQQNGIDITLDLLHSLSVDKLGILSETERVYKPLTSVQPFNWVNVDELHFKIEHNVVYDWSSLFSLDIPENVCAILIVRSSLNRIGGTVNAGNYDSGYRGLIGGSLTSRAGDILIAPGTRIAQIMFYKTESASLYKGVYQQSNEVSYWGGKVENNEKKL